MRITAIIAATLITVSLSAQDDFYHMDDDVETIAAFEVSSASSRGYDPRYRGGNLSSNPIKIVKRADVVTLELTVTSVDKKPHKRIAKLQNAFRKLKESAAARDDVVMKSGYVELPLATSNRWIFSSAKTSSEVSSFNLKLITRMGPKDTVFDRSAFLNEFIDGVDLQGKVNVLYVSSGIGLLQPDKYRNEILKLVAKEVRSLVSIFGSHTGYQIRGLDKKVQVRQIDEVNLELSLPYQLTLSTSDE